MSLSPFARIAPVGALAVLVWVGCKHRPAPAIVDPPAVTPDTEPHVPAEVPTKPYEFESEEHARNSRLLVALRSQGEERCEFIGLDPSRPADVRVLATMPIGCGDLWRFSEHPVLPRVLLTVGSETEFSTVEVDLIAGSADLLGRPPTGRLEGMQYRADDEDGEVAIVAFSTGPEGDIESDHEAQTAWMVVDDQKLEVDYGHDEYGGAVSCRSWLRGQAWTLEERRVEQLYEGMSTPWCTDFEHPTGGDSEDWFRPEQFPSDNVDLPTLDGLFGERGERLSNNWGWVPELQVAFRTFWFEGYMDLTPAYRWDGAAWHAIEGLGTDDDNLTFDLTEDWALACADQTATLLRRPELTAVWSHEGACPVWLAMPPGMGSAPQGL